MVVARSSFPGTGPRIGAVLESTKLIVSQSGPLYGTVKIQGAKNSVLKLMAATLLCEGEHLIRNVPEITDVAIMAELLSSMGSTVTWKTPNTLSISTPATKDLVPVASYELVDKMRASIVVLGPLMARMKRAQVSLPGGDDFGHRPIDMHLDALSHLGCTFSVSHGYVSGVCDELIGQDVVLEFPSHTATDNVLMASVLADSVTTIDNAAREPEVSDLATMLQEMGAKVEGAGTSRLRVIGTKSLIPADHEVIPDRVEAATFICAVGVLGGEVQLDGARNDHMDMLIRKMSKMGVEITENSSGLLVRSDGSVRATDVATLPYPGVATDYKPMIVAVLSVSDGVSIVTENLFSGRFRYIDELRRMAADIRTEGHHVIVRGVNRLSGAPIKAPDIRAGAALVIAALAAEGQSEISGVAHIDRGYERLDEKLSTLGASIERE